MTRSAYTRWLGPILVLLVAVGIFIGYKAKQKDQGDTVFVEVKAIQQGQGWGYEILTDGKVYIHQEFIPAIQGKLRFKSESDALLVGRKVVSKIAAKQIPNITIAELKEMGIINDSVASAK